MSKTPFIPGALTPAQQEALLEFASHGPAGSFDQEAISQLFGMGLIEVRNEDRRVVLTERGKLILAAQAIAKQSMGRGN